MIPYAAGWRILIASCLVSFVSCRFPYTDADSDIGDGLVHRLKQLINQHRVMVFMKGNRDRPRCGFSKTVISILNDTCVPYGTFDILEDEEVRQNLKIYSNWPTYPQVYVDGDFVGGVDIIQELKETGDLVPTLDPSVKPRRKH